MTLPAMCDPLPFRCLTGVPDHGRQRIYRPPIARCDLDVLRCTGTDRQARRLGRQRRALMVIPVILTHPVRAPAPCRGCGSADGFHWDDCTLTRTRGYRARHKAIRGLASWGWTLILAMVCTLPAWPVIWVSR